MKRLTFVRLVSRCRNSGGKSASLNRPRAREFKNRQGYLVSKEGIVIGQARAVCFGRLKLVSTYLELFRGGPCGSDIAVLWFWLVWVVLEVVSTKSGTIWVGMTTTRGVLILDQTELLLL